MGTALQIQDVRYGFTPEQVEVIKSTIAPGASNDELALFMMVCQKTGLDPFSRQIYLSERWSNGVSKKTPETTIDGFRVIAERSGKYAGQVGPFWCGDDGIWKDVWLFSEMPSAAKVGILRSDFKEPVWGVALFLEYAQYKKPKDGKPAELNSMWQKMGANQLAKCAESLGLRKAFPRDLSGMYTKEEMAQNEERGSKESQQEVAQRRIKELSAPADPSYEDRQRRKEEEAEAVLQESAPKTRKRGDIPFKGLEAFKEMKRMLKEASDGTDTLYYDALRFAGVEHADELDVKPSKEVYKIMLAIHSRLKQDQELKADLEKHALRIGAGEFYRVMGANGFSDIEELIANANGDQIDCLFRDLREVK